MKLLTKIKTFLVKFIKRRIFYHNLKKSIFEAFDYADDWIMFLTKFVRSCDGMSDDDVKKEFMSALASKIHDDNQRNKQNGNDNKE